MSKKFFTLISGDSLHIAPKTKVVPAESFSRLLDIKETISEVKKDAEKYRTKVASECEKLKEQAQREGFEEGFRQWSEQLAYLKEEIGSTREEITKIVIPLALKAAKKIVGREIEMNKETILDIVKNNLSAVSQHTKVTIFVNKQDLATLEKKREELKNLLESAEVLNLRERGDITPGGCVIETEVGIINAQLENQWLILEQAFEALTKAKQT